MAASCNEMISENITRILLMIRETRASIRVSAYPHICGGKHLKLVLFLIESWGYGATHHYTSHTNNHCIDLYKTMTYNCIFHDFCLIL